MLFILDANGVPSVARMVSVQGNSLPASPSHSPRRRDLHRARHRQPRGDRIRHRRHGDEGRVFQRRDQARHEHRPIQLPGRSRPFYKLTARATDNLGAPAQARHPRSALVTPRRPRTSPHPPTARSRLKPTITVTAAASDPDGNVTKSVPRRHNGARQNDRAHSYTWRNPFRNPALAARATDNAGAVTTSGGPEHRSPALSGAAAGAAFRSTVLVIPGPRCGVRQTT